MIGPVQSGSRAVDLVCCAAVLLDVLVPTILIGEAPQESLTRKAASDVANTVFAFFGRV